jgi:uncharacterized protein with GYD domain
VATYVVLMNWTEQGIKTFKDSPKRSDDARPEWSKLGVQISQIYWTVGPYDVVLLCEAADEESMASALLRLGSAGNVRTTTLRAFSREEFDRMAERAGG